MTDEPQRRDLAGQANTPGWTLHRNGEPVATGTLEHVAKEAHARRARGENPGIVRRIENSIELEMLQLEQLWRDLGLPL